MLFRLPCRDAIKRLPLSIEYRRTIVVNYTDDSLLPADNRDWRDLNMVMMSPLAVEGKFADEGPTGLVLPPTHAMTTQIHPRLLTGHRHGDSTTTTLSLLLVQRV